MNKYLRIYLGIFGFVTMGTSLLYIAQILDKLGVPFGFTSVYVLIHIGSFALMLTYAKEL